MITIYYKSIKDKKVREPDKFLAGSWINVEAPTDEEIKHLAETYSLDEGLLKDATDIYEVPRMEIEDGITYIFTTFVTSEDEVVFNTPVLVCISDNFVLTLSSRALPFLDKLIDSKTDFYTTQKTKLFLHLLVQITSGYNHYLHNISRKIRSMSIKLEDISNKDIVQFVTFETVLNDSLSDLVPTNNILNNLLSGKYLKLYEDDRELVEDLLISNDQLIEVSKANLKMMVNIREAYSTIMTNNLNRVIKLFTSLTVILTIPMIITSLYGMNVKLPLGENAIAFEIVIVAILVSVGIALYTFNRNKWL